MQVKEIMTKNPACATAETNLQEIARMMVDNDCGCIPIVDGEDTKRPTGMLTDRDITVRTVAEGKNPLDLTAGDVMTEDVVTVTPEMSVEECSNLMEQKQIRRVAVVDKNGACVGMVAQADIATKGSEQQAADIVQEVSKANG
ncbi:MAG: CBS domain-containing protein [Acidobacteriota bacterium]|nr:CBS domain-containing protein [Acidobacteriota bacterium]